MVSELGLGWVWEGRLAHVKYRDSMTAYLFIIEVVHTYTHKQKEKYKQYTKNTKNKYKKYVISKFNAEAC